ncbi:MAG TPA: hypothetical protein VL333_09175 [Candidatus Saccharimonadales bacterium]|nr:hypothetical protein [Candidatus Saccharimonadales bacterium]
MFYLFVLGAALVIAIVVALVRDDVPDARFWTLLLIGSVTLGPLATVLVGTVGVPDGVDVFIALVLTPLGFTAGAFGAGLVMVRGGRHRDLGVALLIAGASVALLAIYAGFAIVVTSLEGGEPSYQRAIELIVQLGVAAGITIGAVGAILVYVQRGTHYPGSLRRLP